MTNPTKTFTGNVSIPTDNIASKGKYVFQALNTVNDTLIGLQGDVVVDVNGAYSVELAYNNYQVWYHDEKSGRRTRLGKVTVSADTEATTINDLLGSFEPVSPAAVLIIQGYLALCRQYSEEAESARDEILAVQDSILLKENNLGDVDSMDETRENLGVWANTAGLVSQQIFLLKQFPII